MLAIITITYPHEILLWLLQRCRMTALSTQNLSVNPLTYKFLLSRHLLLYSQICQTLIKRHSHNENNTKLFRNASFNKRTFMIKILICYSESCVFHKR